MLSTENQNAVVVIMLAVLSMEFGFMKSSCLIHFHVGGPLFILLYVK